MVVSISLTLPSPKERVNERSVLFKKPLAPEEGLG